MAEPLKNSFGPDVPRRIGEMIMTVNPEFRQAEYLATALDGYEALELTPRARHIAGALARYLPADPADAIPILIASLGPKLEESGATGMALFTYLPHVFYVAEHGLDHFELSMKAQYELTQRFSAEYSIRAFLDRYPAQTLARLRRWATDPSMHVRRLVSEGTRPRLPWAPRLRAFVEDPGPVLELLELLKDDREQYVRRSVANNLNDIAKDHPELVVATCARWAEEPGRRPLVRHALRTLIKAGHPGALGVLGFAQSAGVSLEGVSITPGQVHIGENVRIAILVRSQATSKVPVVVDIRVHFVKANNTVGAKVFKGAETSIDPGGVAEIRKTLSLAQRTTRTHYPGRHRVEVLINGDSHDAGAFDVLASSRRLSR